MRPVNLLQRLMWKYKILYWTKKTSAFDKSVLKLNKNYSDILSSLPIIIQYYIIV